MKYIDSAILELKEYSKKMIVSENEMIDYLEALSYQFKDSNISSELFVFQHLDVITAVNAMLQHFISDEHFWIKLYTKKYIDGLKFDIELGEYQMVDSRYKNLLTYTLVSFFKNIPLRKKEVFLNNVVEKTLIEILNLKNFVSFCEKNDYLFYFQNGIEIIGRVKGIPFYLQKDFVLKVRNSQTDGMGVFLSTSVPSVKILPDIDFNTLNPFPKNHPYAYKFYVLEDTFKIVNHLEETLKNSVFVNKHDSFINEYNENNSVFATDESKDLLIKVYIPDICGEGGYYFLNPNDLKELIEEYICSVGSKNNLTEEELKSIMLNISLLDENEFYEYNSNLGLIKITCVKMTEKEYVNVGEWSGY